MRNSVFFIGAFVALSLAVVGPAIAEDPEFLMEVGTVAPGGSPWAEQLQRFKAEVQEKSGGRMKVKLRLGRGNERSLARRVQMGSMQAFAGSVGGMSSIVREVNVIEAPYVFETFAIADKALDNPAVIAQVKKVLARRGLIFGIWAENGYRSYFSSQKIRKPSDMKGVRFRSQESMVHVETYEAFGATPVPIDNGNTLMSVQTGVVDGFDNTPLFAMAASWYQGLKKGERHIFLSRHCYQPALLVYSKKWFETLPKDIQKILTTMPHDLTIWGREQVRKIEPVLLKNLKRYGYEIHDPTPEELALFKAAQKDVPDRVAKEMGPEGVALLKAIRKTF
ncbi:MAG: C4-dicarboxylate ABC transporter substrate-binding protein [Deltaproteobacteria bacterium]|nr:TRAP transporter substrate-binding protein [Deltaproteobacteria bacterium]MBW2718304.1 TRAP transporter substrate-binding protein [Deltaproteobacteria bacterium]RLB42668.1 MAG: C4-dicarboxylate ABC transporter substrate-binding protein [Deltaproteobacteria bacterium]